MNGQWTAPKIVKELSTSDANESPLAISADGNTLVIFKNGKIYSTEKTTDGGWSDLKLFDVLNFKDWNSDVSITADGNAILFSAGVKWFSTSIKIYVTTKQEDGTWSEPTSA